MNSDDMPLISVGIPCYNRPEGLKRTLKCIISQTYKNLEIIISDNCSPQKEEMTAVINEFSDDLRISYIRQKENHGPIQNFKYLLEKATGEYFLWAADDDELDRNYIQSMFNLLYSDKSAGFAFCDIVNTDSEGNIVREYESFLRFCNQEHSVNITSFFLEPECLGKANPFYSVYRRSLLQSFCVEKKYFDRADIDPYTFPLDAALVFSMLCRSKFKVDPNIIFKKQLSNLELINNRVFDLKNNSKYKYEFGLYDKVTFIKYLELLLEWNKETPYRALIEELIPVRLHIANVNSQLLTLQSFKSSVKKALKRLWDKYTKRI